MGMEPRYTIGRLARAAGVRASTVRFYERRRLLSPDARTEGNYRVYGPTALERLRFIRAAQANGFSLEDIAALLKFRDGTTAPCPEVQTLIEERLSDLDRRVEELRQVQEILRASLTACRRAERSNRCRVIEGLTVASAVGAPGSSRPLAPRKGEKSPLTLNQRSRSKLPATDRGALPRDGRRGRRRSIQS